MTQQLNMFEPLDQQTKKLDGNIQLVSHGIQNEQSDYRVHVSYLTQHVYVFSTLAGKKAVNIAIAAKTPFKNATQPGVNDIVTGQGQAIPVSHIDGLVEVLIPLDLFQKYYIPENALPNTKGYKALMITVEMLKRNLIPLPLQVSITKDEDLQIQGTDIIIHATLRLQVKCDYRAGNKKHNPRATGNVFLQTAECNPRKLY